jgi:hypothetical protein
MPSLIKLATGVMTLCVAAAAAAQPAVKAVSLQVDRPVDPSEYRLPGTKVVLDVRLPGGKLLGLGARSAISSITDDTGTDLLADSRKREAETEKALRQRAGSMGATLVRRDLPGNIDHETAKGSLDPQTGSIQVPVYTMGMAAAGASRLRLKGQIELQVAGKGERSVRLDGVRLTDEGQGTELKIDGQSVVCSRDSYTRMNGSEISEFYCWGQGVSISSIQVVGKPARKAEGSTRANLVVAGPTSGLSLEFKLPDAETVRVPVDLEVRIGL